MSASLPVVRTAKLTVLSSDQAVHNWNTISGFLKGALRYSLDRVSLDDVKRAVADDLGMIVIGWEPASGEVYVAFFCEIERYATGRQCWNVSLAGGHEIGEWIHLWPVLKQIGKDQGCDQIEISGRPGWGRVLGLKPKAHLYVEDL